MNVMEEIHVVGQLRGIVVVQIVDHGEDIQGIEETWSSHLLSLLQSLKEKIELSYVLNAHKKM